MIAPRSSKERGKHMADVAGKVEITHEMIEAGARCVRARFGLGAVSHSESEIVAQEVLAAALNPPTTHAKASSE
jgi:hypothetical protein